VISDRNGPTVPKSLPIRPSDDYLGHLLAVYHARGRAVLFFSTGGGLGLCGAGSLARGQLPFQDGSTSVLVGWLLLAVAVLVAAIGLAYHRLGFEVRSEGVRYRSWAGRVELRWDDIQCVRVTQSVSEGDTQTNQPAVRGIRIVGRKRQEIELGAAFLRLVDRPAGLISLLEMHCDVRTK
jgi:hypothetical protein